MHIISRICKRYFIFKVQRIPRCTGLFIIVFNCTPNRFLVLLFYFCYSLEMEYSYNFYFDELIYFFFWNQRDDVTVELYSLFVWILLQCYIVQRTFKYTIRVSTSAPTFWGSFVILTFVCCRHIDRFKCGLKLHTEQSALCYWLNTLNLEISA